MAKKRSRKKQQHGLIITIAIIFLAVLGLILTVNYFGTQQQIDVQRQEAAQKAKKENFIKQLAPCAQTLQNAYHILPSITLAQAILESNWGESTLSQKYHNLFGIKGSTEQETQLMTTQEYENGEWKTVKARFRVYQTDQASMRDHALLLVNGTSWNAQQYQRVLTATTYQAAAQALMDSGYATDPDYAAKLIDLIQKYNLNQYDQQGSSNQSS